MRINELLVGDMTAVKSLERQLGSAWLAALAFLLSSFLVSVSATAAEGGASSKDDSAVVMEIFNEQAIAEQEALELSDDEKHQILFIMGIVLLVLLGATAYFGIAMGIGGKDVFVPHMISAGLAITLSLAHAVTAIVWFFPF